MTLPVFRSIAPLRASAEPVAQDRSLACVLWLLLFLVFVPMIGVHAAFLLFPGSAGAQAVQTKSHDAGRHG